MIRIATEQDLSAILSIYAPYILESTATFEYDVPTAAEFLQRFRDITAQFPWLVWEEQGEVLGYAYASAPFARAAYAWCAEPSVYLRPESRGLGGGRQLYQALEAILALQGYRVFLALITSENTASVRFHEKMGYSVAAELKHCGYKFGRWMGVFWMEKRVENVENICNFPTPWPVIVQDTQKISNILDNLSLS